MRTSVKFSVLDSSCGKVEATKILLRPNEPLPDELGFLSSVDGDPVDHLIQKDNGGAAKIISNHIPLKSSPHGNYNQLKKLDRV